MPGRRHSPAHGLIAVTLVTVLGCDASDSTTGPVVPPEDPAGTGEVASAYGKWEPSEIDTCSAEIHDAWSTVGPDGKLYPTWHPPVDPMTGCTFGHEHGRDPSGSDLWG